MVAIEMILEAIDRLVRLLEAKKRKKSELFTDILEPLFRDLQPVVDEYFAFFRRSRKLLSESKSNNLAQVLGELRESREKFVVARIKVTEMVQAIQHETKNPTIRRFMKSVNAFFYSTNIYVQVPKQKSCRSVSPHKKGFKEKATRKTEFLRMIKRRIDLLNSIGKKDLSTKDLLSFIDKTIENLEESWKEIAKNYAELRIHCLNP